MTSIKLPKIGMRIVKSALAVFLCFVVYLLRGQQGVPFYSAIAAVLCMQPAVSNSFKVAWNRTVGTVIGAGAGMLVLLFERAFIPRNLPLLQYGLVSLVIIPLIYVTLLAKKPTASYITCVVFMSITVSHGADVNPQLFVWNRMLDTLIGIAVAVLVNLLVKPPWQGVRVQKSRDALHKLLRQAVDDAMEGANADSAVARKELKQLRSGIELYRQETKYLRRQEAEIDRLSERLPLYEELLHELEDLALLNRQPRSDSLRPVYDYHLGRLSALYEEIQEDTDDTGVSEA